MFFSHIDSSKKKINQKMKREMKKQSISLPKDEWRHADALHEWWYVNSHLKAEDGRSYGLYIFFFADYFILSLADKVENRVIAYEKITDERLHFTNEGIFFGESSLIRSSREKLVYRLRHHSDKASIDITLASLKEPLIVNGNGKINEGLLGLSWYYALTNLKAEGELRIGTHALATKVSGIAWIDRQWGNWEEMGIGSWIWLSLQLSNGCEILLTEINSPYLNRATTKVMSIKKGNGSADEHYSEFIIRCLSQWRSPETGSAYGTMWEIMSSNRMQLCVEVDFDDQELHQGLWQGSCSVKGEFEGKSVNGVGYAEQVNKTPSTVLALTSLILAPYHLLLQSLTRRPDFGILEFLERKEIWKYWKPRTS